MSILGLDWGEKKIGLAISRNGIAFDYKTIDSQNIDEAIAKIQQICQNEKIKKIIIGLSRNKEGKIGFQAKKQKDFARKLKDKIQIKIIFENELLTTKESERVLKEQNINSNKIEELINQKSAQMILQSYLDKEGKSGLH